MSDLTETITRLCQRISKEIERQKIEIIEKRILELKGISLSLKDAEKNNNPVIYHNIQTKHIDSEHCPVAFESWYYADGTHLVTFLPPEMTNTFDSESEIKVTLKYEFYAESEFKVS